MLLIDTITGRDIIKKLSSNIPTQSGVYKMMDYDNKVIYIGKAKNLKNRLLSYANSNLTIRITYMVNKIANIEWITTSNEIDALILESDLIKHYQPHYNILLKDDKTFPFIKVDLNHNFPSITKFRAKNGSPGDGLFGPFAGKVDINEYIKLLQTMFGARICSDNFFNSRSRPCLLYQIKRCSAPCVNKISKQDYNISINQLVDFLNGNNNDLKHSISNKMQQASATGNFEQAIIYRDRLSLLNITDVKQSVVLQGNANADFVAIEKISSMEDGVLVDRYIVKIFIFRNSHNFGSLNFFPQSNIETTEEDIFYYFITQFYINREIPENIYINIKITKRNKPQFILLQQFLNERLALKKKVQEVTLQKINKNTTNNNQLKENIKVPHKVLNSRNYKKVTIKNPLSDSTKEMMNIVISSAKSAMENYFIESRKFEPNFKSLQELLSINDDINKIEVYDNSHLYGTFSLGALITAKISGFDKKQYRTFNIKSNIKLNDDYAILKEVLKRRFKRLILEKEYSNNLPNLIIIDGGKGQLNVAIDVLNTLNLLNLNITIISISKGKMRNAKDELIYLYANNKNISEDNILNNLKLNQHTENVLFNADDNIIEIDLYKDSKILHFIQMLRDEAHRFAIKSLRNKKIQSLTSSELENIPFIGNKRKKLLLNHFGSFAQIKEATLEDLLKVPNINKKIATKIFNWYH